MQDVLRMVDRVAPTDSSVLILGESGTGKELVARAIHERSPRRDAALRRRSTAAPCRASCSRASCSATRRARSPARSAPKPGLFELADGGTLFLDEIGEMAPDSQVKLLRVLEIAMRSPASAARGRRTWTCGWSPPPTATWRRR